MKRNSCQERMDCILDWRKTLERYGADIQQSHSAVPIHVKRFSQATGKL